MKKFSVPVRCPQVSKHIEMTHMPYASLLQIPVQASAQDAFAGEPHRTSGPRATMAPGMSAAPYSDEELVSRSRETGDAAERDALTNELLRRYFSTVARWCLRFTPDREIAADLAQEILTKAYLNLGAFQCESRFSTWLFTIARNHCLNAVRADKRSALAMRADADEEILPDIPDTGQSALDLLERQADARTVRELLSRNLEETERKVFVLHYGEDLSLDAITRLLGLDNASGAKAYIVSARRKLARIVERRRAGTEESRR
jgi:RNA polymerase sigma factor (sigma-70 family)